MKLDREEYRNSNGVAAWWQKDGAWHVARPREFNGSDIETAGGEKGFFWTDESYNSKIEAVEALQ